MFPFPNNNGYQRLPFSYNNVHEAHQQPHCEANPFIYSFLNPNYVLQHQNTIPNILPYAQMPYFIGHNQSFQYQEPLVNKNTKRLTRKLSQIELRKKIKSLAPDFKIQRKSFKYFDPSRAPPISTLRNNQQLSLEVKLKQQQINGKYSEQQKLSCEVEEAEMKLQILMEEPDKQNYPFLICKRRKYHRNLKRRYSVAYFQQRALYIINKEPIPPSLHPKNKVRKPRIRKNNSQNMQSAQSQMSYQIVSESEENENMVSESEKIDQKFRNVEKRSQNYQKIVKQQIFSEPILDNLF